jgi:hypothetical protein
MPARRNSGRWRGIEWLGQLLSRHACKSLAKESPDQPSGLAGEDNVNATWGEIESNPVGPATASACVHRQPLIGNCRHQVETLQHRTQLEVRAEGAGKDGHNLTRSIDFTERTVDFIPEIVVAFRQAESVWLKG